MYIFADSGSTKTLWVITDSDGNKLSEFRTIGLNPYFVTKQRIISSINEHYPDKLDPLQIDKVFFYGSGCGSKDNFQHLRDALNEYFFNATIRIFSDMLGTARAVLKNEIGIAAILGTGTNSCLYNGESISQNAISLGYILGDEGSGAYIGKMFAKLYLEKRFTKELTEKIKDETSEDHSSILSAVYSGQHPNRFLANFCLFIKRHIDEPQLQELVSKSFERFFDKYVLIFKDYQNYPLGFCGSIALNFKEFIEPIAESYGIKKLLFTNNPIDGLIEYHKLNKFA
ncbi:MAG: ATPase [Marinilabiliales bacterium]|nr:MAG: ATPase [Marinilabiliales bacterium]